MRPLACATRGHWQLISPFSCAFPFQALDSPLLPRSCVSLPRVCLVFWDAADAVCQRLTAPLGFISRGTIQLIRAVVERVWMRMRHSAVQDYYCTSCIVELFISFSFNPWRPLSPWALMAPARLVLPLKSVSVISVTFFIRIWLWNSL